MLLAFIVGFSFSFSLRARRRLKHKMPTSSQVMSRIEHEAGESNMSMSSERGSFIEKDVHSSASVADEDLRKCPTHCVIYYSMCSCTYRILLMQLVCILIT